MSKEINVCACCGAKMVSYDFKFNSGLKSCLRKLAVFGQRPVSVKELGLTTSEWTNFAKLRYWGLADKYAISDNQKHKGGVWVLTDGGNRFVHGVSFIYEIVTMERKRIKGYSGLEVYYDVKFSPSYDHRGDYRQQVKDQIEVAPGQVNIMELINK